MAELLTLLCKDDLGRRTMAMLGPELLAGLLGLLSEHSACLEIDLVFLLRLHYFSV